jgi:hypothetical protein
MLFERSSDRFGALQKEGWRPTCATDGTHPDEWRQVQPAWPRRGLAAKSVSVNPSPRLLPLLAVAVLLSVLVGFAVGRRAPVKHETPRPDTSVRFEIAAVENGTLVLRVPHAAGSIVLDGDMDDPGWIRQSARTHAFLGPDGATPARPFSEARFVYGDGFLYVGLYAADEDIHAKSTQHDAPAPGDDTFHLVFTDAKTDRVLDLNPLGTLTDGTRPAGSDAPLDLSWESGAHVSNELDGTPNKSTDHDEEWVIEMAIPFESLGMKGEKGERIGVFVERCDTLKNGTTSCGHWGQAGGTKHEPGEPSKKAVLVLD